MRLVTRCPFCGKRFEEFVSRCDACGGSTAVSAAPPEPAPPPPPRLVTQDVRRRLMSSSGASAGRMIAGIAILSGVMIGIVAIRDGQYNLLVVAAAGIFGFGGAGIMMAAGARRDGRRMLEAYEFGIAVVGRVTGFHQDVSVRINDRSPWVIEYAFEAGGPRRGRVSIWEADPNRWVPGRPLHVLYLSHDPACSTPYPPPD